MIKLKLEMYLLSKIVGPKKESLAKAQEILNEQMTKLKHKQNELAIITDKLQVLYDKLATKEIEQRVKIKLYFKTKIIIPFISVIQRNWTAKFSSQD